MPSNHGKIPKQLEKAVIRLECGEGRTKLLLITKQIGSDWIAHITGGEAHVGAIGVGVYDKLTNIASSSVLTITGHREDSIAKVEAERISKATQSVTVLIVGIHLENITGKEIVLVNKNAELLVDMLLAKIKI